MKPVRVWIAAVSLALVAGSGLVLAQDEDDHHAGTTDSDIDLPLSKQAQISPQQMIDAAAGHLKQMKEMLKRVLELQEIAKRQKDIVRLNCVNDKLLQIRQLVSIAEEANTNLGIAIARGDEEGRYSEFVRMSVARDQAAVLTAEAEQCIGEGDLTYLGPTEVNVEGGDEPDDPTQPDEPQFPDVTLPPVASPFV